MCIRDSDNFQAPFLIYTPDFSIVYYNFLATTAYSNAAIRTRSTTVTSNQLGSGAVPQSLPLSSTEFSKLSKAA